MTWCQCIHMWKWNNLIEIHAMTLMPIVFVESRWGDNNIYSPSQCTYKVLTMHWNATETSHLLHPPINCFTCTVAYLLPSQFKCIFTVGVTNMWNYLLLLPLFISWVNTCEHVQAHLQQLNTKPRNNCSRMWQWKTMEFCPNESLRPKEGLGHKSCLDQRTKNVLG